MALGELQLLEVSSRRVTSGVGLAESPLPEGRAGAWVLAGSAAKGRDVAGQCCCGTCDIAAGEAQLTPNVYQFAVGKAKDVLGSEVSCASSRAGTSPAPKVWAEAFGISGRSSHNFIKQ